MVLIKFCPEPLRRILYQNEFNCINNNKNGDFYNIDQLYVSLYPYTHKEERDTCSACY